MADEPDPEEAAAEGALEEALAALDSSERGVRLDAVFQLGEALAGAGAAASTEPAVARAVARLEALAADREAGSWLRKRAKRALRKIRAEPAPADEPAEGPQEP
jgi:hypothetical protein